MPYQFRSLGCIFFFQFRTDFIEWKNGEGKPLPMQHTSFLRILTIYVSSTMCFTNFHTSSLPQSALSQNLPLPCHLGTRGKDNISFCFSASHQTHDSPQKADDFCQDNSQTRTARKMLLLCSSQPWMREYISLFLQRMQQP